MMYKTITKIATALVLSLVLVRGVAAEPDGYRKARLLYDKGLYAEAAVLFGALDDELSLGYNVLCHLMMTSPGHEKMARDYLAAHPGSVLAPQVSFRLGLIGFDAEDYERAYHYLNAIDPSRLPAENRAELAYKKAYSAFGLGYYDLAQTLFEASQALPRSEYTAPARYSLGFIDYSARRFPEAEAWFRQAAEDSRFALLAAYYVLECRFMEKDYKYVVEHGETLFEQVPADRQPHMARLMSESYLILGDVGKARTYYDRNLDVKTPRTRSDFFYAGSVLYAAKDWRGAIENYAQMGDFADSLGQIASYQMGYSHVETGNKVAALDAFKTASSLSYDPAIQEDAYFNYGKLAFDLNGDTSVFDDYMQRYKGSDKGDRIYHYQAMAALAKHDYEAAVAAYDNIDELDDRMWSNYRKAYFLRGEQLISGGSYRAAIPHLKAAAYYSDRQDPFNQLARYWMAEAQYRDRNYAEARTIFTDLYNLGALDGRREGDLIPYGLAYACFGDGDYPDALKWFQKYLSQRKPEYGADARTRIGDCWFYQKEYGKAIEAYKKKMADYPDSDDLYPCLKAGVASGLMRDNKGKTAFLEKALKASPKAPYWSETMFELGRSYVSAGSTDKAVGVFQSIRKENVDVDYSIRSLLELGMISRNAGDNDAALDYFKQVVAAGTNYSEDALLAIEAIYQGRQDPDGYLAYVNSLGAKAVRTDEQKETVYFNTAEQVFLSGNWAKAIMVLRLYQEKYPQGTYLAKSDFYLAESYRQTDARELACDHYQKALSKGGLTGSFEEQAWLQYAQVSYGLERYTDAYGAYRQLSQKAKMDENRQAAHVGMMRSAYRAKMWADAIREAEAVAQGKDVTSALRRESDYVLAKSYLATSRRDEAFARLEKLAANPSTAEGAEACYLLIQDCFDRADYKTVEDKVYDFAAKSIGQEYYLAKAYIVLGDAFAETGKTAQAKATFESIRDGYKPSGQGDDVLDQVNLRLKKL